VPYLVEPEIIVVFKYRGGDIVYKIRSSLPPTLNTRLFTINDMLSTYHRSGRRRPEAPVPARVCRASNCTGRRIDDYLQISEVGKGVGADSRGKYYTGVKHGLNGGSEETRTHNTKSDGYYAR
jgi:hypothetical protein